MGKILPFLTPGQSPLPCPPLNTILRELPFLLPFAQSSTITREGRWTLFEPLIV